MNVKEVLKEIDFSLGKKELDCLKKESNEIILKLRKELQKQKFNADVFLGGSLAKETLIKKNHLDIDIFVRFDWKIDNISLLLERIVKKCFSKKWKIQKIHGSRDYFGISKDKNIIFELIPVTKIKKPEEARNITDLSYFHVDYIKNKLKKTNLTREIALSKAFSKANQVYGAESYINGFSGYGLECLIIYYKSFEKMLRELIKVKDRIIIDSEKKYKKKGDIVFELNESKLHSPIVLIDPTWKERNVLAALSKETFDKFKIKAKEFLKKPSKRFFEDVKIDVDKLKSLAKKKNAEFVQVEIKTGRQAGDIAGTKMKKFSKFLISEISKYFDVLEKEFEYSGKKTGDLYLILKSKKEIIRIGPPSDLPEHAKIFRKKNKNVFEKNGLLHTKIKINFTGKKFVNDYKKKNSGKLKDMGIIGLGIV